MDEDLDRTGSGETFAPPGTGEGVSPLGTSLGNGTLIMGRYQLAGQIGRGGMGEVYLATDLRSGRKVAVKTLPITLADNPGFRDRFLREQLAASRLEDPHIVPVYDFGDADGYLYLVMRYVAGPNLADIVHQDGPLTAVRAVGIISQIANALDAAHARNLIHRDVKPQNILLDEKDFAYLIDFGIVLDTTIPRLTQTGAAIGTLGYMAPEVFEGASPGIAGDVYSLGSTLFFSLTGENAWKGESAYDLFTSRLEPAPRPSLLNPSIPLELDQVVSRAMALNPEARYSSASELAEAAKKAIDGSSTRLLHPLTPAAAWPRPVNTKMGESHTPELTPNPPTYVANVVENSLRRVSGRGQESLLHAGRQGDRNLNVALAALPTAAVLCLVLAALSSISFPTFLATLVALLIATTIVVYGFLLRSRRRPPPPPYGNSAVEQIFLDMEAGRETFDRTLLNVSPLPRSEDA